MKSNKYWANRQAWNMYHQMELSEQTADEIAKLYLKASRWLTLQSMEIFEKFMDKHGLTEPEARILLNTLQDKNDINRLIQILKSSASTPEKKEIIRKLEAPAYGARIERLRQLQNQLDQLMTNVYHQELVKSTAHYVDLANEAFYRTMFEIQQRAGYGFSFNHISRKQIDRVLQMNWSGKHYSKRIWKNTKALADDLKEELLLSLVTGRTDRETAQIIQNKFASGAMQARRLVRTESCFVSGELTAKAYEECGIEKYRYVATLDLRTSLACRDLDGQEFYLFERKTGKNYPPMHPWCRSTTIAAPTAKELAIMKRKAFDPETGKHVLVPASMTYKEWYKKYAAGSKDKTEKAVAKPSGSGIIKENGGTLKMDLQFFAEKDIKNQESNSLKRAIRHYEQRITEHESYIKNPKNHVPDWDELTEVRRNGLIRHWNKEIRNFRTSINDRVAELKERGDFDE